MNQCYCQIGDQVYLFTYRINPFELSLMLEKMARYYELIIYSILPIKLIKNILSGIKNSEVHISHILSYEDITFFDNYAVKDLSIL